MSPWQSVDAVDSDSAAERAPSVSTAVMRGSSLVALRRSPARHCPAPITSSTKPQPAGAAIVTV